MDKEKLCDALDETVEAIKDLRNPHEWDSNPLVTLKDLEWTLTELAQGLRKEIDAELEKYVEQLREEKRLADEYFNLKKENDNG